MPRIGHAARKRPDSGQESFVIDPLIEDDPVAMHAWVRRTEHVSSVEVVLDMAMTKLDTIFK